MKKYASFSKIKRSGLVMLVLMIGLATVAVSPAAAAGLDVCASGCSYSSIQAAITAASPGDRILVSAGTYTENITVNKQLEIIGAGSTTVITQTAAGAWDSRIGVVQLTASGTAGSPILLQNLRIKPVGMAGISVGRFTEATGTSVSYVSLDNVQVIGTNTSPSTEQERGLYVDLTSSLTNLTVTDSAFNNLTYGWYVQKQVSAESSTMRFVDVSNTTFNHNNHKGIYAEKLSDAVFSGCTFDDNGYDSSILPSYFAPWSAGVDINLKAGVYANLRFENLTVTDNAIDESKEGVGLAVKARDDGATYGAFPATVSNVAIISGIFTGNERGIRIGEPGKNNATPTNVVIQNVRIYNNTQHYSGADGSIYGDVINMTGGLDWIDATNNWWGGASGPLDTTGSVEVPVCNASPASDLNVDGTGAGVNDYVDYCPWLTAPPAAPVVSTSNPADGTALSVGPAQISVTFSKDVKNDGTAGAVNNPVNFMLVEANSNGFQTVDCASGVNPGDTAITVNSIAYTNGGGSGPFEATLEINGSTALQGGSYRLFVCGTTSVEDLYGIELNDGANDATVDFSVASTNAGTGASLPATGFPLGQVTVIHPQPAEKAYSETAVTLEIPSIGVSLPIVGVPRLEGVWDVDWLYQNAGWLHGSAFPTWSGNTILTGHVWDANNAPGPFAEIKRLRFGDQVKIHAWGQTYVYEVQESQLVFPGDVSKIFQHEDSDWVTLLTCEFFNPFNGDYYLRRIVRAVLVDIQ